MIASQKLMSFKYFFKAETKFRENRKKKMIINHFLLATSNFSCTKTVYRGWNQLRYLNGFKDYSDELLLRYTSYNWHRFATVSRLRMLGARLERLLSGATAHSTERHREGGGGIEPTVHRSRLRSWQPD